MNKQRRPAGCAKSMRISRRCSVWTRAAENRKLQTHYTAGECTGRVDITCNVRQHNQSESEDFRRCIAVTIVSIKCNCYATQCLASQQHNSLTSAWCISIDAAGARGSTAGELGFAILTRICLEFKALLTYSPAATCSNIQHL